VTLVSQVISDAYRESMLTGLGETPNGPQSDEALRLLNRLVASVFGNEVGERLTDWPIGSSPPYDGWGPDQWEYLCSDIRIVQSKAAPQTLNLPPTPQDGDRIQLIDAGVGFATYPVTLKRQASRFNGAAADYVANTDAFNRTWMYRADLADWLQVLPLDTGDTFPFPEAHDDAFIGMLATRLNPRYVQGLSGESGASLRRSVTQLRAAYTRTKPEGTDIALRRLTGSRPYLSGGGPASLNYYIRGGPDAFVG
jgi:hypothetical protein